MPNFDTKSINNDPALGNSLRKRWLFLLPAVFVTYSLAYLDRANFGFGVAAGLAASLHITEQRTALLGGLFFLGYLLLQVPGARFARTRSASWLVFWALVAWGTFAALTGVIRQFWLLALDRFLLGVAESVIFPAMLVLLTRWFTRAERSRANAFLILGNPVTVLWMSVATGYLIDRVGWRETFVIEGLPSLLWAVAWRTLVRDRPAKAGWMTAGAVEQLERMLAEEQAALASGRKGSTLRQTLLRADVVILGLVYFFWSLGVYGFVLWLPTMVRRASSFSMGKTGLFAAIPYVAAVVLMLAVAQIADRTGRRRSIVWPCLVVAGASLMGSFLLAEWSFTAAFVCLVLGGGFMYAPYGPFLAIVPERVSSHVSAEVMALVNTMGALGGFVGSYCVGWLGAVTGRSQAGYLLMSVALLIAGGMMAALPRHRRAR